MRSFLKLIRYKNLLMVLLTLVLTKYVLIKSFSSQSFLSNFHFILLSISILCITAGGYIINDVFDVLPDKINKPSKVSIGHTISKRNALISYGMFTIIGLGLGVYLSIASSNDSYSFVFIFTAIGLFLYSKLFKKIALLGNLLISSCIGLSIYLISLFEYPPGGLIEIMPHIDMPRSAILFYVKFSFIATFIREIIKDIEDINGDYAAKMKTLPILIGIKRTNYFLLVVTFIFLYFLSRNIYVTFIDGSLSIHNSIGILVLPILYFFYKLLHAKTKKTYTYLSNFMKFIMLLGILTMIHY